MSGKTSQLQIRVSPAQKQMLKHLAADAGVSVSAFVLAQALPARALDFNRRIARLKGSLDRDKALSDLILFLSELSADEFAEVNSGPNTEELPLLLQNIVAASVEHEAQRRSLPSPQWTAHVEALSQPHFAWDMRSLRPHLMRTTLPAYKRRNVFVAGPGTRPASAGQPLSDHPPNEFEARFLLLNDALGAREISVELCLIGGAVVSLVFTGQPSTRRPAAMFQPPSQLSAAVAEVADRLGLPSGWLRESVRGLIGQGGPVPPFFQHSNLWAYEARPDYVLAMTCAALRFQDGIRIGEAERDAAYLLHFLGIQTAGQAMDVVRDYLNERQHPEDLEIRFTRMLNTP